jgi:hypothetical protein
MAGAAGLLLGSLVNNALGATEPTNIITSSGDVTKLFCAAMNWFFWGLIVLSIIMVLVSAYKYAYSAGDAERVSKATRTLTYAAIAIVIAIIARAVPLLIGGILGVKSGDLTACS